MTRRAIIALASAVLGATSGICLAVPSYTPINDLGTGLYLGQYQGGLYPNGSNDVPAAHAAVGIARAGQIVPLNTNGQPDASGKFVFISIGMSNTSQEYAGVDQSLQYLPYSFMGQSAAHPAVNHSSMVLFNGARGGQSAAFWDSPSDTNYSRIQTDLTTAGLSEAQVEVAWLKVANPGPTVSLPAANADANVLVQQMGNIVRAMKTHYTNLKTVFVSSRIYAGYATSTLNPEPYAYESGFAVKRLIQAQINQAAGGGQDPLAGNLDYTSGVAPWLVWGPYMWADGLNPRSDGLTWAPTDFGPDGTHPNDTGRQKVGAMLVRNMLTSPFAQRWYLSTRPGDANLDHTVNLLDFNILSQNFGLTGRTWTTADFDYNGVVNLEDFNILAHNFGLSASAGGPTPQDWANLSSAIPEPASGVIPIGVTAWAAMFRRRRSQHQLDV